MLYPIGPGPGGTAARGSFESDERRAQDPAGAGSRTAREDEYAKRQSLRMVTAAARGRLANNRIEQAAARSKDPKPIRIALLTNRAHVERSPRRCHQLRNVGSMVARGEKSYEMYGRSEEADERVRRRRNLQAYVAASSL